MNVTLINVTPFARETLIFTKRTRLNMTPGLWAETLNMPEEEKLKELEYMASSIPSSWEFVDYTFLIEGVSRAFTHQFVRTRTNSYAQQSMRVTNMDGFDYVTGPSIDSDTIDIYDRAMFSANRHYNDLIREGVKEEDARGYSPPTSVRISWPRSTCAPCPTWPGREPGEGPRVSMLNSCTCL